MRILLQRSLLIGLASVLFPGCTTPGPTSEEYGVRNMPKKDRTAMLDNVEAAMVKAGFRIDKRDAATGLVTSFPDEDRDSLDSRRTRGRTRRVAEVQLQDAGDSVKVYCKVLVQQLATGAYSLYAQDRATSDSPGEYTAINRDAATTEQQNAVWKTMRRDKLAERAILDEVLGPNAGGR